MSARAYIQDFSVACAAGADADAVARAVFSDAPPKLHTTASLVDGRTTTVGPLGFEPGSREAARTRSNRLVGHLLDPLRTTIQQRLATHSADRLGVVIGTSTAGMFEGETALAARKRVGAWAADFSFRDQELSDPANFVAAAVGARGPVYVISTACTSGGKAIAAAARLLAAQLCDTVICGGVDTLCDLTLNGFSALESLSETVCNPFSRNRRGINIGEGGALYVLTRDGGPFALLGAGESSDAHHISAPEPTGAGAEVAIRRALLRAGDAAADIDFIHLHGTATRLNDQAESAAIHRVFGDDTPASSTKPLTGHTLGAAGAIQTAICLLALRDGVLPPHLWDGERDPDLPHIRLAEIAERADVRRVLSANYAFGGNNIALVLAAA
ncbi:MAG: beta-ketoacyl-ACP synthase [Hyphomonadaceae bacterium]|nr:beta-ketoacyl-ACP synthase [Hyphomonadaceae bacterium]